MSENGRDRELMKKYGFKSPFAYKTFMAMKGDRIENGSNNNQGKDWTLKTDKPTWPYSV